MVYTLAWTLPNGAVKTQGPYKTKRAAAMGAAMCLRDNRLAGKADARRFSPLLTAAPLGEPVRHEASGYAFQIIADGGE